MSSLVPVQNWLILSPSGLPVWGACGNKNAILAMRGLYRIEVPGDLITVQEGMRGDWVESGLRCVGRMANS